MIAKVLELPAPIGVWIMQALDIDVAREGRQDRGAPIAKAVLHGLTRCDEVPV
jgi:hypothetical protein